MLASLTERAAAGVEVRVIIDALGSFGTHDSYSTVCARPAANESVSPPALEHLAQRQRPHPSQAMLIVRDGETGFIGGAGVGDH